MAQLKFGSAGVTVKEIDLSAPTKNTPTGTPAGIIGTANLGPAFVPMTFGSADEFYAVFGATDGEKFGPLAVNEWMKNAGSVTYLRVLGAGDGNKRDAVTGEVSNAGFVVGDRLYGASGAPHDNSYANLNGVPGRTFFLGAFMSESLGSTFFSTAGIQSSPAATPVLRGVVMAPSGVLLRLSASTPGIDSSAPTSNLVATNGASHGAGVGFVNLASNKQEFVMLLNGHKGSPSYPNVITASFDSTAPNYFANIFNSDPEKIEAAGHYLYSHWSVPNAYAMLTGSGLVVPSSGSAVLGGIEPLAFMITGSAARNTGAGYAPNYESFRDRFSNASTPWFLSQKFGGEAKKLFKLHALSAGVNFSSMYKVMIENIVTSSDPNDPHGTFDLVIRNFGDLDTLQQPVEQWRGLSLDPSSDRYISKVIGDTHMYFDFDHDPSAQKLVVQGNYANNSNLVRVEVADEVENGMVPSEALPVAFRGIAHVVTSGSAPFSSILQPANNPFWNNANYVNRLVQPPIPFRNSIAIGTGNKKRASTPLCWGVQFETPPSVARSNETTLKNESIQSYTQYFPNFSLNSTPFWADDNAGAADTAENGVIDVDRFCNNFFSLENILVVTESNGIASPTNWAAASYVRAGSPAEDPVAKTRGLAMKDFTSQNRRYLKFSTIFQGGFDGVNIFDKNTAALNDAAATQEMQNSSRGYSNGPTVGSYRKAIDIMKNVSDVEIQVLAIPGIRTPGVSDYALAAVEDRFDALFLMDIQQFDDSDNLLLSGGAVSVTNTVQNFIDRNLNSSFGAAYFPDVVVSDPTTVTNVTVPPSVALLGALALNDSIGYPWFAPAGFARGALGSALSADVKLSKDNMDVLYDAKINPITSFPGTVANPAVEGGLVVWGQKTLLQAASALDRVNVRRLLIEIRRQVRLISQSIIFEPNRETTLAKFSAAVTPILQRVQSLAGVERFKVIIDASTTTQQDVENNTVRGKIYLQPTKTVEFVSLDFVVTNNIAQQ